MPGVKRKLPEAFREATIHLEPDWKRVRGVDTRLRQVEARVAILEEMVRALTLDKKAFEAVSHIFL